VQHVLLAILQALRGGRVKDINNLDAYVFGTCRNAVMDMRRGRMRQQRIIDESIAAALPAKHETPRLAFEQTRVDECLAKLESRSRAVVLATFVDERNADDIARTMSLSPGNVRVIRHRALAQLQRCVEGARS
jgi:RNA polymerase sigma-70 factor (ECF subfamily)